eukprot:6450572-Pyramimonas_sp.AAC.1
MTNESERVLSKEKHRSRIRTHVDMTFRLSHVQPNRKLSRLATNSSTAMSKIALTPRMQNITAMPCSHATQTTQ